MWKSNFRKKDSTSTTSNQDPINKTSSNLESFKESKIEVDEIVENNEYLSRRNDQLEEIKK
jgi:hypothetical protein